MQATGTQTRGNGLRAPPGEGARARRRLLLPRPVQGFHALLPALAVALGCGGQPFPGSSASLDELGRAALEAFFNDDREALEALRLSETEHNTRVWPELPAARGESPFPIDLAWRNIQLRNRRAVSRVSAVLAAAQPIEFESVECNGETQVFDTFVVHTDCHTRFRTRGRLYRIQLFKDALERNGGFKIFRYYDEDPELVIGAGWPDDGERSRGGGSMRPLPRGQGSATGAANPPGP